MENKYKKQYKFKWVYFISIFCNFSSQKYSKLVEYFEEKNLIACQPFWNVF
jgi:hypothetical protein